MYKQRDMGSEVRITKLKEDNQYCWINVQKKPIISLTFRWAFILSKLLPGARNGVTITTLFFAQLKKECVTALC